MKILCPLRHCFHQLYTQKIAQHHMSHKILLGNSVTCPTKYNNVEAFWYTLHPSRILSHVLTSDTAQDIYKRSLHHLLVLEVVA